MNYFLRNPDAADDLYGIASFRLLDQTIYQHVADVNDALEWLVSVGWLKKTSPASSRPLFRLNQAARREAEKFVAGRQTRKASRARSKRSPRREPA